MARNSDEYTDKKEQEQELTAAPSLPNSRRKEESGKYRTYT
jgi:hypothetical protein